MLFLFLQGSLCKFNNLSVFSKLFIIASDSADERLQFIKFDPPALSETAVGIYCRFLSLATQLRLLQLTPKLFIYLRHFNDFSLSLFLHSNSSYLSFFSLSHFMNQ